MATDLKGTRLENSVTITRNKVADNINSSYECHVMSISFQSPILLEEILKSSMVDHKITQLQIIQQAGLRNSFVYAKKMFTFCVT